MRTAEALVRLADEHDLWLISGECYDEVTSDVHHAFYLWVDVRQQSAVDVRAWALDLLRNRGVAVAPGTTFGPEGEGWARVSLATAPEDLLEGLRRILA